MKKILAVPLLLTVASVSSAATVFVDCPAVSVEEPPAIGAGNQNATPCTLATPPGTITLLTLTYKYSFTTDLGGGTITFDHSANNPLLGFWDNGAPIVLTEPPSGTTGNLTISKLPTAPELAALAADGSINMQWSAASDSVLTLSGDFRWTITYDQPPSEVPEPATSALFGSGLLGLAWVFRKMQSRES